MTETKHSNINSRVKKSFGLCHVNLPNETYIETEKSVEYEIDYKRKFYLFDIVPMGAVRMTQSDRWKTDPNHKDPNKRQREVVARYFNFKSVLLLQSKQMNFELTDKLDIVFLVPMPASWSEKKKSRENKQPVRSKPDLDNYVKAFMDALSVEDGFVWKMTAEKRYAYRGSILVYA